MEMKFARSHPMVIASYLLIWMMITMFSMHPVLAGLSLLVSFLYSLIVEGKINCKQKVFLALPVLFVAAVVLPMFSHNGITPIYYINNMAVTLETVIYGLVMSMVLISMIWWFQVWNRWIDSEKFIYLFGRISPRLALLVSMVLRFVPLFLRRFKEIQEIQKGMGYTKEAVSLVDRIRLFGKEISILISWALENSMDTAMSMEARGYGLQKRSSFHLFEWKRGDSVLLAITCLCGIGFVVARSWGAYKCFFFPGISILWNGFLAWIGFSFLLVLAALPLLVEGVERL